MTTNPYFQNQNEVVIRALKTYNNMSTNEATKFWFESNTRKYIQDNHKLEHISGARCYDELMLEINKDKLWLSREFD